MKTTDLFRLVAIGLLPAALGLAFAAPARGQECPNAAIRAAQGPAVETLPDCMALEQVSQKNYSQNAHLATVSANGERILFHTGGAIGDPPGVLELFFGD
ncbi:MAG TPA: hypothetical protein VHH14_01405, partial [Solirubrobacterales bacterium]|nr:hypothetical protein [Solirubrobacterales bacterium]